MLMVISVSRDWLWPSLFPRAWSLRAWSYILLPGSPLYSAIVASTALAVVVGAVAVAFAIPAARALAMHSFRGRRLCLWLLMLPLVAPPTMATMGLHRMLLAYSMTETMAGVALCHLTFSMPYAILALLGSFK